MLPTHSTDCPWAEACAPHQIAQFGQFEAWPWSAHCTLRSWSCLRQLRQTCARLRRTGAPATPAAPWAHGAGPALAVVGNREREAAAVTALHPVALQPITLGQANQRAIVAEGAVYPLPRLPKADGSAAECATIAFPAARPKVGRGNGWFWSGRGTQKYRLDCSGRRHSCGGIAQQRRPCAGSRLARCQQAGKHGEQQPTGAPNRQMPGSTGM